MAAYAALLSVMHIIHQIQHHPFPPISLDSQQIQSLTEILTFLQDFLERYNSPFTNTEEPDPLETRIADAAYAAADVIESHIFDNIMLEHANCINFYEDVHQLIEEMDLIRKEVMEMIADKGLVQNQLQRTLSTNSSIMVGFDDVQLQIMDMLTGGRRDRQVIPIAGMGGIGKTTLAKYIYAQPLIKERFDVCVWATISEQYNTKRILYDAYSQVTGESKERMSTMSEGEVGLALYQYLSYKRFLLVMDDMWSIEAWVVLQRFFPENGNSSRIFVTTRLSKLGSQLGDSCGVEMKFLARDDSWNLFSKIVFGEKDCLLS